MDIGNSSVLIADAVASATTKCYICVYSEKNGVQMPGGTDKCIDPHGGHETLDIGVDQCRGMCYVSKNHTKYETPHCLATQYARIIMLLVIERESKFCICIHFKSICLAK